MLSISRKAAVICPIAHKTNCFIDIHFWWPQYDKSSSFFLIKDYTFMLLFSSIFPVPTWLPCWAPSAPPSQLCLCPASYKEPWAPLPIVFSLSRETPLLLHTLLAVWYLGPLSHYSPRTSSLSCWCFTAHPFTPHLKFTSQQKTSGVRQLICIISIGA